MAAIEFAVAAPVIIMLLLMILELGYLMTGGLLLNAGARAAARYAVTGQVTEGEARIDSIRRIVTSYVCPSSQSAGNKGYCFWNSSTSQRSPDGTFSPLLIKTRVYSDARDVGQPEPYSDTLPSNGRYDPGEPFTDLNGNGIWDEDMAQAGAGGPAAFVIYDMTMPEAVSNPLFRMVLKTGLLWQKASIALQNETF